MVEEISPADVQERLDRGDDLQVVDIRPESAYESGHVPGAVNIPFDRFADGLEEYEWDDEIVVVCPKGESSRQAARLLESYEGVADDATVANMADGYEAWDYGLESGPEAEADD